MTFFTKLPVSRRATNVGHSSRGVCVCSRNEKQDIHYHSPNRVRHHYSLPHKTTPYRSTTMENNLWVLIAIAFISIATSSCDRARPTATLLPEKIPELSTNPPIWAENPSDLTVESQLNLGPPAGETATLVSSEIVTLEQPQREPFQSLVKRTVNLQFTSQADAGKPANGSIRILSSQITNIPAVGDWVGRLGNLLSGAILRGFYPTDGAPFQAVSDVPPALTADLDHISMVSALMFACFPVSTWDTHDIVNSEQNYKLNGSLTNLLISCRSQMIGYAQCASGNCPVYVANFKTNSTLPSNVLENRVTARGTGSGTAWMLAFPDGRIPLEAKLVYDMTHRLNLSEGEETSAELTQKRRAVVTWNRTTNTP